MEVVIASSGGSIMRTRKEQLQVYAFEFGVGSYGQWAWESHGESAAMTRSSMAALCAVLVCVAGGGSAKMVSWQSAQTQNYTHLGAAGPWGGADCRMSGCRG